MVYVICVLIALVLFLSIELFLLKKEMRSVSREMKANEDKRHININLVDDDLQSMIAEVNNLYEIIMRTKAETEKEEERLRESVSMISHDMRTPLTSIIGYLQVADRSEDREEVDQNIGIALERAKYLNKLVNDFFEISLIDSGQVTANLEEVNLSEIICEEILAESPEIDRKGIEPKFEQADENIFVMADRKMLSRVIQNLTSNAVKYSQKRLEFVIEQLEKPGEKSEKKTGEKSGGKSGKKPDKKIKEDKLLVKEDKLLAKEDKSLEIEDKLLEIEDKYLVADGSQAEHVRLSIITDTDKDIDTEMIFRRFYKENTSRTEGGAGLGLYICRSFVEKMGGQISAECEDGEFRIIVCL